MAALWLQCVSLLVLLVVSSPSSQAASKPLHPCGYGACDSYLAEALYLVCGDRGVFYRPRRDVDPLTGFLPPKAGGAAARTVKRSAATQCCQQSFNIFELQSYCN